MVNSTTPSRSTAKPSNSSPTTRRWGRTFHHRAKPRHGLSGYCETRLRAKQYPARGLPEYRAQHAVPAVPRAILQGTSKGDHCWQFYQILRPTFFNTSHVGTPQTFDLVSLRKFLGIRRHGGRRHDEGHHEAHVPE